MASNSCFLRFASIPIINSLFFFTAEVENESTTPHTKKITRRNSTDTTETSTFHVNVSSLWESEQRDKYTVVKRYIPAEGKRYCGAYIC